jgi:radical SAM superfamily enzyme YgiQ (UPF0313 family)
MGKRITVDHVLKFFENVKKLSIVHKTDIDVVASFVIGFPWEDVED